MSVDVTALHIHDCFPAAYNISDKKEFIKGIEIKRCFGSNSEVAYHFFSENVSYSLTEVVTVAQQYGWVMVGFQIITFTDFCEDLVVMYKRKTYEKGIND